MVSKCTNVRLKAQIRNTVLAVALKLSGSYSDGSCWRPVIPADFTRLDRAESLDGGATGLVPAPWPGRPVLVDAEILAEVITLPSRGPKARYQLAAEWLRCAASRAQWRVEGPYAALCSSGTLERKFQVGGPGSRCSRKPARGGVTAQ
jgi:hypothetical protein